MAAAQEPTCGLKSLSPLSELRCELIFKIILIGEIFEIHSARSFLSSFFQSIPGKVRSKKRFGAQFHNQ
jgi:hypothetical protein